MQKELPFVPNQLDLHYRISVLLHQFRPENYALEELNKLISQRIDTLNDQLEQLKESKETQSNQKVIVGLRDWKEAILRFNAMNKR